MLRSQQGADIERGGRKRVEVRKQQFMVFSVGNERLAARIDEVWGIEPWTGATTIPSTTPFVTSVIHRNDEMLPVYQLAEKFGHSGFQEGSLCLIIKHADGPLAICIDGRIPSLHTVDGARVRIHSGPDPDVLGTCTIGEEEIPIINLKTLGG
ncbi:chemotaxis protein CheW [Nitrospirales bacterium NOB]|nr:MAG: putative cheW-like signal transduction protein [Nitrospira sp. OLB3]MBV6470868.1 hypothetical protein [Nitrospirota bacterium]MCE7966634.1 chemotaxis protein CheW [Nitrospira sp. NTP2]MCK6494101.1 chemotaxis protein CheW [Nitrospira sp.]MDL1888280.1 chemotaxis protein CheW [Nitrospirales bacterium NOB]MEB2339815.1 chemotaxis protein CheW [Nitrospirales bacterium]